MRVRGTLVAATVAAIGVGGVAISAAAGSGKTIRGCVQPAGQLRVIEDGQACRENETPIEWNQTGPQGPPGPQGEPGKPGEPGEPGPAGDPGTRLVLAQGFVLANGIVTRRSGPLPTVTSLGGGRYRFEISGVGTECVLPIFAPYAHSAVVSFEGGFCGAGAHTTTVVMGDGVNHAFTYNFMGSTPGGDRAAVSAFGAAEAEGGQEPNPRPED